MRDNKTIEESIAYAHGIFNTILSGYPGIEIKNYDISVSPDYRNAFIEVQDLDLFDHFSLTDIPSARIRINKFIEEIYSGTAS